MECFSVAKKPNLFTQSELHKPSQDGFPGYSRPQRNIYPGDYFQSSKTEDHSTAKN